MAKRNDQRYWFKRRRYGYGYTPVTWEGWMTIAAFLLVVFGSAVTLLSDVPRGTYTFEVTIFIGIVVVSVLLLLLVSMKKGPSPKWRWGAKKGDNPDEDF